VNIISNQAYVVTVTDQKTGEVSTSEITKDESLLLSSGTYEILAKNNNGSYFEVVSVGRFLSSAEIDIKPQPESDVSFIATNSSDCGLQLSVYVSYACGSSSQNIKNHLPARDGSPPYSITPEALKNVGVLTNTIQINNKWYVIVQTDSQNTIGKNSLYELVPGESGLADLRKIGALNSLSSDRLYYSIPYKTGFIAYSSNLDGAYYYKDFASLDDADYIEELELADFDGLDGATATSNDELIVFSASNQEQITETRKQTVVKVLETDSVSTYRFDQILTDFQLCAEDLLCAISIDSNFLTYDVSSGTPKLKTKISGGKKFTVGSEGGDVRVARNGELLDFNLSTNSGSIVVSYNSYEPTSIQSQDANTNILVVRNGANSSVVKILETPSTGNIFQTLSDLSGSIFISSVSVYDKQVFMVPKLGELEYDVTTGIFDYNPNDKARANNEIQSIINRSGGNSSGYTFINLID
jgi:hypothetical protein